jgi:hypothetical protein
MQMPVCGTRRAMVVIICAASSTVEFLGAAVPNGFGYFQLLCGAVHCGSAPFAAGDSLLRRHSVDLPAT